MALLTIHKHVRLQSWASACAGVPMPVPTLGSAGSVTGSVPVLGPLAQPVLMQLQVIKHAVAKGAADVIVHAMTELHADAKIQSLGCEALDTLCTAASDTQRTAVGRAGASMAILHAMEEHSQDEEVQRAACAALLSLVHRHDENSASVGAARAIPLILSAMRRYPMDEELQQPCVALLLDLASRAANQMQIIDNGGGVAVILEAMKDCPVDWELQTDSALLLGCLLADSPDANGIHEILAAMKQNASNQSLQVACCGVLDMIANSHACKRKIVEAGGCKALMAIAGSAQASAPLKHAAQQTLSRLLRND